MYCKKCGKQYPNDVKFCGDCGVPLEEDVVASKHFPFKIVIPVVAAVLAVAVGVGAFFFIKKGDETDKKDETTVTDEVTYEQEISSTNELADLIASLNSSDYEMATIDVFAENYSPASKDENQVWDPILFYALEGYGDESGYISKNNCNLIRKQLKNVVTGNIIQYEIYINPNSDKPNKIVSIENTESGIDVMEYYFTDDSKINFIFKYSTDNYVTTYATPDKDGERFLFNNDSLCTWRFIQDGGIANFVCGQNEADRLKDSYHSNQIFKYSDLNDEQKNQVDTYEKQMINAAYNTLNTVMAADGIATISGMAVDSNGNALANATVDLFGDDFSTELFSCTTDDTGAYNILVPVSDYNYNITVSLDGCLACSIFDILINASNIEAYPDTAYMIPESDSEAEVQLTLGDAANYAEDGETLKRLSNAVINVRAGINNKLGDILYTFNSDENGYSAMSVKAGVYTIEVQATGYESMYYTVVSNPTVGTSSYSFYAAPELVEGQLAVVLTWGETPNDLDSHLFTSSGSDTQQVWYSNRSDDYGNWLDVDDTSSYGPETITISQFDASKYYKYCVVDYTNSSAGNSYSTEMSYSGANVSVYNSNGLIASYNMPKNVNALVWEVFEIRNGVVSPIQRYYDNNSVENNYWWDGNNELNLDVEVGNDYVDQKRRALDDLYSRESLVELGFIRWNDIAAADGYEINVTYGDCWRLDPFGSIIDVSKLDGQYWAEITSVYGMTSVYDSGYWFSIYKNYDDYLFLWDHEDLEDAIQTSFWTDSTQLVSTGVDNYSEVWCVELKAYKYNNGEKTYIAEDFYETDFIPGLDM